MLWVTPTDITDNIIEDTEKYLSKKGKKLARIVPNNSILVTSIASIGKNALTTTEVGFNQQINAVVPDKKNDPYFLLTQSFIWSSRMKSFAAAATMQIVNKSDFSNIITHVPKYNEQLAIGSIFRLLDQLIASNHRNQNKPKWYTPS